MISQIIIIVFTIMLIPILGFAAEYNGCDIDGHTFDATAFSYSTGRYYFVSVEFYSDEAYVYFPKGGYIVLSLDSEEIDDPSCISAFHYRTGTFWDLEVDLSDYEWPKKVSLN